MSSSVRLVLAFSELVRMGGPGIDEDGVDVSGGDIAAGVSLRSLPRNSSGQHVRNRSFRSPAVRLLNVNSGSSSMAVHLPSPCLLTPIRSWLVSSSVHRRRGFVARRFSFDELAAVEEPASGESPASYVVDLVERGARKGRSGTGDCLVAFSVVGYVSDVGDVDKCRPCDADMPAVSSTRSISDAGDKVSPESMLSSKK